jgi:phenylalanyl-tRNA synthetase beta chain
MKVSLNWVKKYGGSDLIDIPADELVKLATERLGGIEGVTNLSKHYKGIIVAKVVSCEKHANADKLSVCKLDDSGVVKNVARDENGFVQVVCGAPNVATGQLVAWIPPQAIVPASYGEKELFVLEARELRGELSNGMLASPRELGVSEEHDGILVIEEDVAPGTPFVQLFDLDDTILDIENKMFTHRPDGFGQLGVAREIAGIQHKAFTSPEWYLHPKTPETPNPNISVTIEDQELCPRYMAVEFTNVHIKPSPVWLQSYLKRVGIRPINTVVDVTNYIMMETAQPLHAFDYDKVAVDGTVALSVRRPKEQEKLTLLDGKEIQPHPDAALIASAKGPIALGGVMGGGTSEIDQNTTRVVLECATFNMYNIRKTSMIHGIFTDAATRLTKGQPAEQLPSVLVRAIELFKEVAGATLAEGVTDAYPAEEHNKPKYIEVTSAFINDRLGSKFTDQEIIKLLTNVEFKAHVASGPLSITPPFWRPDIEIPEDIVEEVGRMYGFNRLPSALPLRTIAPVSSNPQRELKQELRNVLSRAGANELLTYSFVHGHLLQKANQDPDQAFALRNALSPDLQYYRLSVLPSLLDKIRPNIKAGYDEFTLFEIGKAHNKQAVDKDTGLPEEVSNLEMVYTSAKPKKGAAYFHMLSTVDYTLSQLGVSYRLIPLDHQAQEQARKVSALAPYDLERSAYIFSAEDDDVTIGFIGELKQEVVDAFKLPQYTAAAIFSLDSPCFDNDSRSNGASYEALSRYPSITQDITLQVSAALHYNELKTFVSKELQATEYTCKVVPLGIYQKDHETKNITFRITLSHYDRTLTTDEVNELVEKITWKAHEALGAQQV